jgi:hypothetical protein
LLPVLSVAATETVTFESHDQLERALSVGVRSAIASGWTLVDVSHDYEAGGFAFTLTREGDVERHVALFDGSNTYRVGPGEVPEDPTKPSEMLLQALRGRGGIEIASNCGGYHERPYLVDDFAVGPEARELVARSLAAADDLEGAWMTDGRAMFKLERGGDPLELLVTLTEEGGVADAELRRYESGDDESIYRRRGAMVRALRGAFVSSIQQGDNGLVLRTNRGRFSIDPDGSAFRSRYEEAGHEGCGC